jgi:hypothetical protein
MNATHESQVPDSCSEAATTVEKDTRWTPKQAAEFLGVRTSTLANWRAGHNKRVCLPYYKRGHYVFYDRQDLIEYAKTREVRIVPGDKKAEKPSAGLKSKKNRPHQEPV